MTDPKEEIKFQFRLEEIYVTKFDIVMHPPVDVDAGLASMEFGFNFTFDTKQNTTNCLINFKYYLSAGPAKNEKDRIKVMTIDIRYIFSVIDLAKYIVTNEDRQALDTGVLVNLVNVAYSTSRGIIYEKTRGYGFNSMPLPILNVEEYVRDITFTNATQLKS